VNPSTRESTWTSNESGIGSGIVIAAIADVSHQASTVPATAPISDSTTASVTSWRTSRPRLAPSASLIPISFCRLEARASSMLATFAQAISSTSPTTPIRPAAIGTTIGS
jgi:hypothetical protein